MTSQLEIEGAVFLCSKSVDNDIIISIAKASQYSETFVEEFNTNLTVKNSSVITPTNGINKTITEFSIEFPGYKSFSVYVPLPFNINHSVIISLLLSDGSNFQVSGDALSISVGESTSQYEYKYES